MARTLDHILVIDLESTCWEGAPPEGQVSEIIEVGLCPVDVTTLSRVSKRSILVAPSSSTVSPFCTSLTTITPELLADAGALSDATRLLKKTYKSKERLWASWGDYDRRQFERECKAKGIGYPFGPSHLNVKSLFGAAMGLDHEVGLDDACARMGIEMEGTHHRGDDDAWNIAAVLCALLKKLRA